MAAKRSGVSFDGSHCRSRLSDAGTERMTFLFHDPAHSTRACRLAEYEERTVIPQEESMLALCPDNEKKRR